MNCDGGPLSYLPAFRRSVYSKKLLISGSLVHTTLKNIVHSKMLLQDIKILTGFHCTSALEVFYSLLLKYCPKRQHFSYREMQARLELTILDHNYYTNRKQATTKKGICMHYIQYNTKFWREKYLEK